MCAHVHAICAQRVARHVSILCTVEKTWALPTATGHQNFVTQNPRLARRGQSMTGIIRKRVMLTSHTAVSSTNFVTPAPVLRLTSLPFMQDRLTQCLRDHAEPHHPPSAVMRCTQELLDALSELRDFSALQQCNAGLPLLTILRGVALHSVVSCMWPI